MTDDPRSRSAAFRPALLAVVAALLLAASHPALAKDGGSGGSGSDHSGSGDSGSGGHGSDDSGSHDSDSGGHGSDDSGGHGSDDSGSNSGRGGGDDRDDGETARGGKNDESSRDRRRTYEGGWRVQIRHGRYQVFDPAGRVVINRKAKASDYRKF